MKLVDNSIPLVTWFKYLGWVIQNDEENHWDINHWIQVVGLKWKWASSVLCDVNVPLRLKENFYKIAVIFAVLYDTEYWAAKNQHKDVENFEINDLDSKIILNTIL